jgi:rhomboid protease GluP
VPIPLRWQYKIDHARDAVRNFFSSGENNARPRMCPSCGTLVGTTATKCHVCGASIRFGMAAASRSLGKLMPQTAPVTYSLLSLCCLFYGISLLLTVRMGTPLLPEGGGLTAIFGMGGIDQRASILLGESIPFSLQLNVGEPWRYITAIFLHGSLMHIVFNMWVLMDIGPMVEDLYGSARYLFLFVLTGAMGYGASSMIGHFSVGASGALLGLIGLLLAATTRRGGAASQMLRSSLIKWVIYILIMGFMFPGIDNAAHVGGFITGFALGKVISDRQPADAAERRRADMLGWATAIVVLLCFGLMVREFLRYKAGG